MSKYEWDEKKNKSNIEKHHIDFKQATEVFNDESKLEIPNEKYGEKRIKVIGFALDLILSVVYTMRKITIRIISARSASKQERKLYKQRKNIK